MSTKSAIVPALPMRGQEARRRRLAVRERPRAIDRELRRPGRAHPDWYPLVQQRHGSIAAAFRRSAVAGKEEQE